MLRIENISKSFTLRGIVLDNLSMDANEGDSIAITGPSGSGKTTLMNIVGALERPDSGNVQFKGRSVPSLSPDEAASYRNSNVGFVFQNHLLLKHLTVLENIMLPLFASKISSDEYSAKEEYAAYLMERTGIKSMRDKFPFQISGGEAQRVALVRALICKPSMLLADEPTGSLDARNADLMGSLLVEMNSEFGIILIVATHSTDLAAKMKQHLKLVEGKLIR